MRLIRVQVPEFRALKNVDISFEPEFNPQVFPLGSLNGGGKSTLLQLIFVLLHCSAHEKRHPFIANMLERMTIPDGETNKLLAKFELLDDEEKIELEFTLCNDNYLRQLDIDPIFNKEMVSFNIYIQKHNLLSERANLDNELKQRNFSDITDEYGEVLVTARELAEQEIEATKRQIETIDKKLNTDRSLINSISENLIAKNQCHITTYLCNGNAIALLCLSSEFKKTANDIKHILATVSKQVFLSAPSTQIYLFLSKKAKQSLFKNINERTSWSWNGKSYDLELSTAKSKLPNFITYDVFATPILVSLIEKARNQDFKALAETGTNGNSYPKTIKELDLLTQNKKVRLQFDDNAAIIGITFQTHEGADIYPEDLSHGELKRLSIYVWLKSMPQDENIVLMDEIENGLHPDWQRHIVDDLVEWGGGSQFMLATHSYELCRGVTPAHVKELDPKLLP